VQEGAECQQKGLTDERNISASNNKQHQQQPTAESIGSGGGNSNGGSARIATAGVAAEEAHGWPSSSS